MIDPHEAIRQLLFRYCELMDAGDFAQLAGLFADAVLVDERGNLVAEGRAGVQSLYERGTRSTTARRAPVTSRRTRSSSRPGRGHGVRPIGLRGVPSHHNLPLQPIITGRYRDRFARSDDGTWHFVERSFSVDLVGDLSQHLRYDVPT